jgi:AcrR family transcriptional regulator
VPPRAGLNEAVIVGAAAELADADGLESVSLARLASHLRVRAPSLYNHIAGQEGVRRGLAVLAAEQLAERLSRAAIGKSGDEAVYAIATAYRAFAKERPGLYAATQRAPEAGEARYQAAAERILEVIGAGLEPLRLEGDDLIDAIRGLRSLVHGFVSLEAAGGFGMLRDVDRSFRQVLSAYLRGLAEYFRPIGSYRKRR